MDRRKRQRSGGKYCKKRSGLGVWTLPLLACAFLLIIGGVLAKYVTSNRQRAEMESSQFHISSNYLEEAEKNADYTVTDWGSGFDILLFNYEKENIAQISGVDMTYQVAVAENNASVSVTDQDGAQISADPAGSYAFQMADAAAYHTLHVTPNDDVGANQTITVTVKTTAPYRKTLQANFQIRYNKQPDYTVKDQGSTVLVTVKTNDYSGTVTVSWDPAKFSPDNTNDIMGSWKDENHTGTFTANRGSTYSLLFFKNTNQPYESSGTGTTVTLN